MISSKLEEEYYKFAAGHRIPHNLIVRLLMPILPYACCGLLNAFELQIIKQWLC